MVEALAADGASHLGKRPLAHNKRIVNLGVELMGRSQAQVLTGIHDALVHLAPEAREFSKLLRAYWVVTPTGSPNSKTALALV
jgi:hypothetical protein